MNYNSVPPTCAAAHLLIQPCLARKMNIQAAEIPRSESPGTHMAKSQSLPGKAATVLIAHSQEVGVHFPLACLHTAHSAHQLQLLLRAYPKHRQVCSSGQCSSGSTTDLLWEGFEHISV